MESQRFLNSRWLPLLIFLGGCLLYGMNIGARDFWAPDEPDFAQIVTEMKERDTWLVPYLNGKPYNEKPPMLYWCMMASEKVFGGPNEFAYRLPSVLAGAGGLVLIFLLGRRMFSPRVGLAAAIFLATSFQYLWRSAYLQTDMLFTFFCFLTIYLFWRLQDQDSPSFWKYALPFYLALTCAALTKGPLAGVMTFLSIFGISVWERRWDYIRKLYLWQGFFIVVVLTGWWYVVVGSEAGAGFLRGAFIREHINRFFDTDSHKQPIYYYFMTIWGDLFPWSLFIPAAVWGAWTLRERKEIRFLLVWFFSAFIFLTITDSKQGKYLLPVFPAMILLIAYSVDESFSFLRAQRIQRGTLEVLSSILFALGVLALVVSFAQQIPGSLVDRFVDKDVSERFAVRLIGVLHSFLFFGALALFAYRDRSVQFRMNQIGLGVMLCFWMIAYFYSDLNSLKSARALAERTSNRMEPNAKLGIFGSFRGTYTYYSGHPIQSMLELEQLREFIESEQPRYCFTQEKEYLSTVEKEFGNQVWRLDESRVGGRKMVLFSNRPPKEEKK